ncbi:hypothetical protein UFOVP606_36 [uncultured Caudovirales phage]|uniref:Uncharacterized protein n=1 Tax=uncultured Caudovirales phage TaxID=2100421 RepID=A0A6J5N074_9CAUD|nr:hypothetical protein UFOVP606_36 [uncultured Caudovirales phage]
MVYVTIKFKDAILTVAGWHTKGKISSNHLEENDTHASFDITEIEFNGVEVSNLLEDYYDEIESACIQKLN